MEHQIGNLISIAHFLKMYSPFIAFQFPDYNVR